MRVAVIGLGAGGARAARQLASTDSVEEVVLRDLRPARVDEVASSLGDKATGERGPYDAPPDTDVVVLAAPAGLHVDLAGPLVARGIPVVSMSDSVEDVRGLLAFGPEAGARGSSVVIGAGFAPGLTCVLAAQAAAGFESVDEIHVARIGTAGPACARQHHRALGGSAIDWRDGGWVRRPA